MLRNGVTLIEHAQDAELHVEVPACERGLRHVSPVKVIHAVRADDALLQLDRLLALGVEVEVSKYRGFRQSTAGVGCFPSFTYPCRTRSPSISSINKLIRFQRIFEHSAWKSKYL
jgi:hypothetical protein